MLLGISSVSVSQRPYSRANIPQAERPEKVCHVHKRNMLFYSTALDIATDYSVVLLHIIFAKYILFSIYFFSVDSKCLFSGAVVQTKLRVLESHLESKQK